MVISNNHGPKRKKPEIPEPFKPHPHLDDEINRGILESELQGGLDLQKIPTNSRVEVWTKNRRYLVEKRSDGYYISGHPEYCPEPIKVLWIGSVWGEERTSVRHNFIGRGMNLQFRLPWQENEPVEGTKYIAQPHITTSPIEDVRELSGPNDKDVFEGYEREAAEGLKEIKEQEKE